MDVVAPPDGISPSFSICLPVPGHITKLAAVDDEVGRMKIFGSNRHAVHAVVKGAARDAHLADYIVWLIGAAGLESMPVDPQPTNSVSVT